MIRFNSRMILPLTTSLLGAFWLVFGLLKYGWWGENGPQSGFFPAIIGSILLIVSILSIFISPSSAGPQFNFESFTPILAVIAVVMVAFLIGFFPSLTLFILLWMKFYEKYDWFRSVVTTVATIAVSYGVFSLWLKIPFPEGLILNTLRG